MNEFKFTPTQQQTNQFEQMLESLKTTPGALMSMLQKAQDIFGYLPQEVQVQIAQTLDIPVEEVYGVATFYSQFRLVPRGKYTVGVCLGTACYVKGSGQILDKIKDILKIEQGQTTPDGIFTLDATRCVGCCGLAPVMTINDDVYGKITADDVAGILNKYAK